MADLTVPVRYYRHWTDPEVPCIEANLEYGERSLSLPSEQSALVLVDVWDNHLNASHLARTDEITKTKIAPVVRAARKVGMAVVHAPSPQIAAMYPQWTKYAGDEELFPTPTLPDWPPSEFARREGGYAQFSRPRERILEVWRERLDARRIVSEVEPQADDFVVATGGQLHRLLRARRVLHLFYVGFATNICVPFRDYGMRAFRKRGYNLILLRDCTTAIETHDTVQELLITRLAIRDFEMMDVAWTAVSEDFLRACES